MAYRKAANANTWYGILDEFAAFCVANSGGTITRSPDSPDNVILNRNGLVFLLSKELKEYKPSSVSSVTSSGTVTLYARYCFEIKVKYPNGATPDWATRMTCFNFAPPFVAAHFFANKHDCSLVVEVGEKQFTHFSFGQAVALDQQYINLLDFCTASNFCMGYDSRRYSDINETTFNYGGATSSKDRRTEIGNTFHHTMPFGGISFSMETSTLRNDYFSDSGQNRFFKTKSWVRYFNNANIETDTKYLQLSSTIQPSSNNSFPDKGEFGSTVGISLYPPPYITRTNTSVSGQVSTTLSWHSALNRFTRRAILKPIYFTRLIEASQSMTFVGSVKGVRLVRMDHIEEGAIELGRWMCFPLVTKIERPCDQDQPNKLGPSTGPLGYAYFMGDFE